MLKDLLAPTSIPDWTPDIGVGEPIAPSTSTTPTFEISDDIVAIPSPPANPSPIEQSALLSASTLLGSVKTVSFNKTLLLNPLTAQPMILLMVLDEVSRQQNIVQTNVTASNNSR